MIHVYDCAQGSEEWHRLRSGKYTGTSAHKLLRYGAIEYALTEQSSFGGNFYTKRGHILEDEAINLYERLTGRHVDRPGFVTNDRFPDAGYSPDGLADLPLIECKAFNKKKHLSIYYGEPPFEVLAQIHFGLTICERKLAHLLIYNPDFAKKNDPDYNPKLALKIIEIKYNRNIANNFKRILGKETREILAA